MDFCPYCQKFPGDDHLNDDLSKGTKDHINFCLICGRQITNNPIKHVYLAPEYIEAVKNGKPVFWY